MSTQVIKYLHADTVADVLTQMETLVLTSQSDTINDSDSDTESETDLVSPVRPVMISRQLFSSPPPRIYTPKTRDNELAPRRKKPRRRKRKECGGYDLSPTATPHDDTHSSSESDVDHIDIEF